MSDKSNLFFKALANKGPVSGASGLDSSSALPPKEPDADDGGGDESLSNAEKLAAYEMMEAMNGAGGEESRALRFGKALKSFLRIADSQPHTEGGTSGME